MNSMFLLIMWITTTAATFVLILIHRERISSQRLRKYANWIYQRPWRTLITGEINIALFSWWLFYLYQMEPLVSIIDSPLYRAFDIFIILSLLLSLLIARKFKIYPSIPGTIRSVEELYEREVLAWKDYSSGLDYIADFIQENEQNPGEVLRNVLSHIASRKDELGTLARDRLISLKNQNE